MARGGGLVSGSDVMVLDWIWSPTVMAVDLPENTFWNIAYACLIFVHRNSLLIRSLILYSQLLKKPPVAAPATTGKTPRFYPPDDVPKPKQSGISKHGPPKVRASIAPGTVLILLAGRFRGKRVVCLKALDSGLLLVSGPYKVNGVPLRRVNQAYVIATSTTVDVSGIDVSSFTDEYFARVKDSAKEGEEEFFKEDTPKPAVVSEQRKADQKKVDAELEKVVESVPLLKDYLGARFSLQKHDRPHKMVF